MPTKLLDEEALFHAARRISDLAARAVFLEQACAGEAGLASRVRALLEMHAQESDAGEAHSPPTADYAPIAERAGSRIGPYRLMEQIGEGGFGVVFVAEQQEPVRRKVALKLIKPGMDSRQVLARFEAERQALALMDHPNIAKVLDAGATDSGRPYVVMELVRGIPITQYCDHNHLTPAERLGLFVTVCHAIQHAHQKGVIHRDIKPSNVLVTEHDGKPVAKVIDFGIAKAVHQPLTEKTLYTNFAQMVGTPLYMSPEQAGMSGLDVDARSDVYSLGVLLYELLTGSTPLERKRFREAAYEEIRRLIREEEAPRPSQRLSTSDTLPSLAANRRTEPAKLSRLVKGELDWIAMKALEKDRSRRYETANGFAADVERYLAGEPVLAVPPSTSYRLRKFARKHRAALATAAAVLFLLVAGIVGTTAGLIRAVAAERAAVAAREAEAEQRRAAEDNEKKAQAAALAEKAAKETALAREAETAAVLGFVEDKVFAAARPAGQAGGLGQAVTLRRAVEAALPFVEGGFAKQPLIEARLRMTLGLSFMYLGEPKIAAEQYQAARAIYLKHFGSEHRDTLASMNNLANSYQALGRDTEALKLREETLALRKTKLGPDHPNTLGSMNNLALSYAALGRHADALKLREETLALRKTKLGPDHPDTLMSMQNLANSYAALGRHAEALKLHEETLALRKTKLGPDHPDTLESMNYLALSYAALGRHAEALKLHEETLALRKTRLGPDHPDTLASMNNLALSYAALGRHAEALKLHEETLALRKTKLGPDHPDTLESMHNLAGSLLELNRGGEAVPIIDECLKQAAGKAVDLRLIPSVINLRLRYFQKANDPAGCRATAEMWEKLGRTDAESLYNAACIRAVTGSVQAKTSGADAAEDADRAMAWLTKAVAAGYKDRAHIEADKDLDVLRARADFRTLVVGLPAAATK